MAGTTNGQGGSNGHQLSPLSFEGGGDEVARGDDEGTSGRLFVTLGVMGILVAWGAVYLGFRSWRANYEALAEFGATQVAPLVDPLGDIVPPDVDAEAWKKAVSDTHGMLLALTGSGLLDRPAMEALRGEVIKLIASATHDSVRGDLIKFWDDLEHRAGPVISPEVTPARPGSRYEKRHPRPARPEILRHEQDKPSSAG